MRGSSSVSSAVVSHDAVSAASRKPARARLDDGVEGEQGGGRGERQRGGGGKDRVTAAVRNPSRGDGGIAEATGAGVIASPAVSDV